MIKPVFACRRARSPGLILALVVAAVVVAPVARADGDPASDYLLREQTFVPTDTGISAAEKSHLDAFVASARRGGYSIRVALIASRYDLGSVTVLDKKPRLYAHFLAQELRLVYKGRLLVVMPNGYGIARNGKPAPAEQKVLDGLSSPTAAHSLAAAAEHALRALAGHAGVRIVLTPIVPTRPSRNATNTGDRFVIPTAAAVVLLLLLLGAGGLAYVHRRRASRAT